MTQIPKQRLPLVKKDKDWRESCIKGLISESSFSTNKRDIYGLYEAYNGEMDTTQYNYVTNPYNSDTTKKRNFPAKLRNYNIIKPVVDLLMGEKAKRPRNYQVLVRNADANSKKLDEIHTAVLQSLQQQFINELNSMGAETGVESKPVESAPAVADMQNANYKDARAITGQHSIGYLRDFLDLDDKYQTAFFDWLVTGEVYSFKETNMDEVEYDIVPTLDIDYSKSDSAEFIEDGDWALRRKMSTLTEVIDAFYDILTEEQIDDLESPGNISGSAFTFTSDTLKRDDAHNNRAVEVIHGTWKSLRKIGILMYPDEVGMMQEMEVDETYKVDKEAGETVEWFWVNQIWEGYQIDGKHYLGIQPIKTPRTSMTNLSKGKLPYNGRKYSDRFAANISIVQMGVPYQILYNIFHYRMELTVAKNKDKIALIEMNTIPKRHGWDEEKFMYYADAMGYAFVDSTAEGKDGQKVAFNQYSVLDLSLSQYIGAQFELLQAVKQEWEDLAGINRQRKGQVMASDGTGATERAVFQSSVMTEELFRKFDKYEEKEMQGLLDVSKFAWRNGKKAAYVTDDYRNEMLDVDPSTHGEAEYSIFVKNSSKENSKLETFKQMSMSFAQNGSMPSTVAEILDSDNFSNIKRLVKEVEAKQQEMEQATAQSADALEAKKMEGQQALQDDAQLHESTENALDRQNKLDVEAMKIQGKEADQDKNDNGIPDYIDQQKLAFEREKFQKTSKQTDRKLDIDADKAKTAKMTKQNNKS